MKADVGPDRVSPPVHWGEAVKVPEPHARRYGLSSFDPASARVAPAVGAIGLLRRVRRRARATEEPTTQS